MTAVKISRDYVQALHDRLDIEDVVSSYVSLKRTGRSLKGLCPFHNEKTPSFTVYPETKSFYCFGCQASGDIISFTMRMENLDYVEAVKQLAARAGMPLPEEGFDDSLSKLRMRILSANREAAKFYNAQLFAPQNSEALDYFRERGLTKQTITHFGLGYAPPGWNLLTDHLKSLGYSEHELVLADLAKRGRNNSVYDAFRNRVIYPIIDLRGNVVAFGARVTDDSKPKYLNTSDTPVYKKGNGVFALNFAKNSSEKKLVLVEGYMDVIALHQAGITNAVACLGTAFTTEQANLLSRYADEIYICYDNDGAGKKATARALSVLDKTGLRIKVVTMEGGKDADEIIRKYGKERFLSLLGKSGNEIEYKLNSLLSEHNVTTDDGKVKYLTAAADVLAGCQPIDRDIYASRLAKEFGVSKESLSEQIKYAQSRLRKQYFAEKKKAVNKAATDVFEGRNNPERKANLKAANAEETLIASFMRNPDFYRKLKDEFSPDDYVTQFNKRIITLLIELIEGGFSTDLSMFAQEFTPAEMDTVGKIARKGDTLANTLNECRDCIKILKGLKDGGVVDVRSMSDEEYLRAFEKLRKKKPTE